MLIQAFYTSFDGIHSLSTKEKTSYVCIYNTDELWADQALDISVQRRLLELTAEDSERATEMNILWVFRYKAAPRVHSSRNSFMTGGQSLIGLRHQPRVHGRHHPHGLIRRADSESSGARTPRYEGERSMFVDATRADERIPCIDMSMPRSAWSFRAPLIRPVQLVTHGLDLRNSDLSIHITSCTARPLLVLPESRRRTWDGLQAASPAACSCLLSTHPILIPV